MQTENICINFKDYTNEPLAETNL